MRKVNKVFNMFITMFACIHMANVFANENATDTLFESKTVFQEMQRLSESNIPSSLLKNAQGIAIIPGVIKVGFMIGGRAGSGIVMTRNSRTQEWNYPVFISLKGASLGWQAGAQSSDVILVFKNRRGVTDMADGKITLGADAAVAAGPVGRQASASTDSAMRAEIYSYSRSRGLFAGVSLDGTVLEIDMTTNQNYYGDNVNIKDVFAGQPPQGEYSVVMQLITEINSMAQMGF